MTHRKTMVSERPGDFSMAGPLVSENGNGRSNQDFKASFRESTRKEGLEWETQASSGGKRAPLETCGGGKCQGREPWGPEGSGARCVPAPVRP